jgi:predicted alternative tryptophan synthase beta-subunit
MTAVHRRRETQAKAKMMTTPAMTHTEAFYSCGQGSPNLHLATTRPVSLGHHCRPPVAAFGLRQHSSVPSVRRLPGPPLVNHPTVVSGSHPVRRTWPYAPQRLRPLR